VLVADLKRPCLQTARTFVRYGGARARLEDSYAFIRRADIIDQTSRPAGAAASRIFPLVSLLTSYRRC